MDKLDGNRARLSFPKLRWDRRGARRPYILAFEPEGESFTVVGEEQPDERDYVAEIEALLSDGKWRTVKEITAPAEPEDDGGVPGIGANESKIKKLLEADPDGFISRTGDEAKALGRHPSATVWQVRQTPDAPDAPSASQGEQSGGESGASSYKDAPDSDSAHLLWPEVSQDPDAPDASGAESEPW